MKRISRDECFMGIAKLVAKRSPCLSRQVGSVITYKNRIISTGYNGTLPGNIHCTKCSRKESGKDLDSCPAIHSESNALIEALRNSTGIDMGHCKIYVTLEPCMNCIKLIARSGIKHIIYLESYLTPDRCNDIIKENNILKERYHE